MLETVRYFLYIPENDIIGINGNNILLFLEYYRQSIIDFRKQNVHIDIDGYFKRLSSRLNCSITVSRGFDIKKILNVLYMDSEVGICYADISDISGTPHIVTAKATEDIIFQQDYYPKNGILDVNKILNLSDRQDEGDLKWVLIYDTDNSMNFINEIIK